MREHLALRASYLGLCCGLAAVLGALVVPLPDATPTPIAVRGAGALPTRAERPDSLVDRIVARDPFRVGRRPSPHAYDPARGPGGYDAQAMPKPSLRLAGFISGTPLLAILDGVPGADGGRLVGQGDTLGGLRVTSIKEGEVRLVGYDTTWVLRTVRNR